MIDAPRHLPALAVILHDIGNPTPAALAAHLGVTLRTVQRWHLAGKAPRAVMLALFASTQWARSAAEVDARNLSDLHMALARAYKSELAAAHAQLGHLQTVGAYGSANAPLLAAAAVVKVAPSVADDRRDMRPAPLPTVPLPARQAPRQRAGRHYAGGKG